MTAKLVGSAPILLVRDVVASANHYRDKLGFTYERFWGEPPRFCMVRRDAFIVMLQQVDDADQVVPHWKVVDKLWSAYFWVDDAEAMYAELQRRGATIDYSLYVTPYHVKEFGVQDLDGHDLAFGQGLEPPGD